MIIVTDSVSFAQECIPQAAGWRERQVSSLEPAQMALAGRLFESGSLMVTEASCNGAWDCLFAVEKARQSQYDALAELAGAGAALPGRVLCCAGEGNRFHGFKGRSWQARRGNIHLSAYVEPGQEIVGGAAGFIVAAVVAALQSADRLDLRGARAGIKWVNDVLVDGAKVGGVLARLQTQSGVVRSAVIGIGLNVEKRPEVERDPYVPAVAALADFVADPVKCSHGRVFPDLVASLGQNIDVLYRGGFSRLLDIYRERSLVVGRHVTIREDRPGAPEDVIAEGRVLSIGEQLELNIEGQPSAVTKGRLLLEKDRL